MPSKRNPAPADKVGTKYEKFNNSKRKVKNEAATTTTRQPKQAAKETDAAAGNT